jgi:hypothetical protein
VLAHGAQLISFGGSPLLLALRRNVGLADAHPISAVPALQDERPVEVSLLHV